VLIYAAAITLLVSALAASLWFRTPFRVNIMRDRGVMARFTDDGKIENVYRLQIMNGTENAQHYSLHVSGIKDLEIESEDINQDEKAEHSLHNRSLLVNSTESRSVIVDLKIPEGIVEHGSHKIEFEITDLESGEKVEEKSVFLVPRD
jgi:polyferredoxin